MATNMDTLKDIPKMVRYHRRQSGLSQLELANFAGVGKTVIFDIENGKETIKLNTLVKVLTALNIKIIFDSPLMDNFLRNE